MKKLNLSLRIVAEMKEYNCKDLIENRDENLLVDFITTHSGYITDVFSEIAENVEVYSRELHENSLKIKSYIDDLNFQNYGDLDNLFMAGEYEYNYSILNDNLENLIFNKLVQILKNDTDSILESIRNNFENINNGKLFTIMIDDDDIENIIDENNIDDDGLLENFKDYIISYIIEKIESREIGENSKGDSFYIPFEIESYNQIKKFCKNAELREPTKNKGNNIFYITDDSKNTFEVLRVSDVEDK